MKVLAFSPPLWKRGGWGRFYYKNNALNINGLLFCKIPLNPPFSKGEVKRRILSQSLKPAPQKTVTIDNMFVKSTNRKNNENHNWFYPRYHPNS